MATLFTPKHVDFVSKRVGNFTFSKQFYWLVDQSCGSVGTYAGAGRAPDPARPLSVSDALAGQAPARVPPAPALAGASPWRLARRLRRNRIAMAMLGVLIVIVVLSSRHRSTPVTSRTRARSRRTSTARPSGRRQLSR